MYSRTSIVYNESHKIVGLPPYYYRKRSCDTNLTTNTPANQYQRLKLIQKTVRVPSSTYTMNLGALSTYNGVCWNQMSDRPLPSVQKATVPTGYGNSKNNKHYSVTSSRPGGQTPGGKGCDVKHNSYDRYLNRLKGKGALRRGAVPPNFGTPNIPFNRAKPIYGAKTMKTNIVSGCDCSGDKKENNAKIYNNPRYQDINDVTYTFQVGQYVYAIEDGNTFYTRAIIIDITDNTYIVQFDNGILEYKYINQIRIYYPCNCGGKIDETVYENGFIGNENLESSCLYPSVSF